MALTNLWKEDELAKTRERAAKEEKLFTVQDVIWEIRRMRDSCLSICDECLARLSKLAAHDEQELNQDPQEPIEL